MNFYSIAISALLLFLGGCATHNTTPLHISSPHSSSATILYNLYQKYQTTPYKYGGEDMQGFDCSGFVQQIYKEGFALHLPRTTTLQKHSGIPITKSALKTGDLLFFHTASHQYHVGIYYQNNLFLHASTHKGVTLSSLNNRYWKKHYFQARRVLH